MALIRAEHLRKTFHGPKGRTVEAVRDASFDVQPGEVFGLLGPNGAGKTTLLRMLAAIVPPTSGACWIDGLSVRDSPEEARRRIGFLSGNTKLYGRLTVIEVLRFFGRLYGMADKDIAVRTAELVDLLSMHGFKDQRCETLSTGQTQRVSIARVILHNPLILILDEPTLGLDIMTSRTILDFIVQAREMGHSIVFSTHHMGEAEMLCDRVGLMHEGAIMAMGTQDELFQETGTETLYDAFLAYVGAKAELAP